MEKEIGKRQVFTGKLNIINTWSASDADGYNHLFLL